MTRQLVTQARDDLAKGDSKGADKLLSSVEQNVVFISVSYQSPLIQAKAALWRASQDYILEDKSLAKTDLDQAVKYLQQAARSDDQITRQAAGKLVSDVRDLHQMIENGDQALSDRLVSALGRVRALSERSVEYISTGWQRMRATDTGKQDLIEAKLQLAYARIDHFSSKDDAAAKVDLAEAKGYLDTAAKQVKNEVKPKVEEVSNLIDQIEMALQQDNSSHSNKLAFEQAESHLVKLIQQI
jgi:TPR repeat protein